MGVLTSAELMATSRPRRSRASSAAFLTIGLLLLSATSSILHAASKTPTKEEVQAAFLYNFCKFVEWPAESLRGTGAPIVIGVLGTDPFGKVLDRTVSGKTIAGRPLVIERLGKGDDLSKCHILYISASEEGRLGDVIREIEGHAVLTVTRALASMTASAHGHGGLSPCPSTPGPCAACCSSPATGTSECARR